MEAGTASCSGDEVVPYNQETDEDPQLYFDHMLEVGDAYALAQEIRHGRKDEIEVR